MTSQVAYEVSSRSWKILRLKKAILDEFPQLRDRSRKASYRMMFFRDPVDLFLFTEKIMDNEDAVPVLLYFTQEWKTEYTEQRKKQPASDR